MDYSLLIIILIHGKNICGTNKAETQKNPDMINYFIRLIININ